jgi:hypothetical protein
MIEQLAIHANCNGALVRHGRYVNLSFLLGMDDQDYVITIKDGRVVSVDPRSLPLGTDIGCFAIRASNAVWEEFWKPVPKRDHHDLMSMFAAGIATIDGDLLPFMQNLQYFKDLLAVPRPRAED